MGTIKARNTYYNGYYFRSRLEARWAAVFNVWGLYWEYEPQTYETANGMKYLVDFRLYFESDNGGPNSPLWVEVKGVMTDRDYVKIKGFWNNGENPILVVGNIPPECLDPFDILDFMQSSKNFIYFGNTNEGEIPHVLPGFDGAGLFRIFHKNIGSLDTPKTWLGYNTGRTARFEHGERPLCLKSNYPSCTPAVKKEERDVFYNDYYEGGEILKNCDEALKEDNYLQRNNIFNYASVWDGDLRMNAKKEILVPYFDEHNFDGLQRFPPNGACKWSVKKALRSAHVIPGEEAEEVILCEGLVTGLNIHRKYKGKYSVHITGTTSMLGNRAEYLLRKYPKLKIKIIIDHKIRPAEGVGLVAKVRQAEDLKANFMGRVTTEHLIEQGA